ncbi:AAA family ATPase, partial [Pseudomonas syringae]
GECTLTSRMHARCSGARRFVGMNCAAIRESLAESRLFGVVNGAFTGVCRAREGYIDASNGGTLYLDEIDSMPLSLQAKRLRVLESRGVERLGSTDFIPLDLRVIASAQRPLDERLVCQAQWAATAMSSLAQVSRADFARKRREQILPLF